MPSTKNIERMINANLKLNILVYFLVNFVNCKNYVLLKSNGFLLKQFKLSSKYGNSFGHLSKQYVILFIEGKTIRGLTSLVRFDNVGLGLNVNFLIPLFSYS
jgi:hypothetical protein